MNEKLSFILKRLDSRHLSRLWLFYRDYFRSDDECLEFIFAAVEKGVISSIKELGGDWLKTAEDALNQDNQWVAPLRMLNCVERMVSTARDMERIRRGKDIFKIIFLVTCTETLQKLSGNVNRQKKDLLFDFFLQYTSDADKKYICDHFLCEQEERAFTDETDETPFWRFVSAINEYRNGATHESEYWDICFNNSGDDEKTPLFISVCAQLEPDAIKTKNYYSTVLSYRDFEHIYVRTCITFIQKYIEKARK